jgi:hypothetical protein
MTDPLIDGADAPALEAAHERYVAMLCAFNRLRCRREAKDSPDYGIRFVEARRHAKEAYAEWVMLAQLGPDARAVT